MKRRNIVLSVTAIVAAHAAAAPFFLDWRLERQRTALVERFHALGIPTSRDERAAAYPMPPEDANAVTYYRKAGDLLSGHDSSYSEAERERYRRFPYVYDGHRSPGQKWYDETWEAVEAFRTTHADVIEALETAVQMDVCRMRDPGAGVEWDFIALDCSLIFAMESERSAVLGDNAGALAALEKMRSAADHAFVQPYYPPWNTRFADYAFALANELLVTANLSDLEMERLAACFAPANEDAQTVRPRLSLPVVLLFEGYEKPLEPLNDIGIYLRKPGSWPYLGPYFSRLGHTLDKADILEALEWHATIAEALHGSVEEAERRLTNLKAGYTPNGATLPEGVDIEKAFGVLGPELLGLAKGRVVKAACALEIYRRRHGAAPSSLSDLGESPMDPYSGTPLRYTLLGDGYVVYSIGPDGKDDNGNIASPPRMSSDIGFVIAPRAN